MRFHALSCDAGESVDLTSKSGLALFGSGGDLVVESGDVETPLEFVSSNHHHSVSASSYLIS